MNNCGNLLGVTTQQVINAIKTVLETEKNYERLRALAPSEGQVSIINRLIRDEREIFTALSKLYTSMTCNQLVIPPITLPAFSTYIAGIKQAIRQEIEENGVTVRLYSSTTVEDIYKVFLNMLAASYLHVAYLNYLLIINMCK